jgi:glucuronoarabinoxylan endo-1,4-beta-xylanase
MNFKTATNAPFESSAYIKGDSLIVMAIDTTKNAVDINLTLPYPVKSCEQWLSTEEAVCQKTPVDMASSTKQLTLPVPARSLVTYIFQIDRQAMAIADQPQAAPVVETAYDLQGRRVDDSSRGFCIVRFSNGCTKKIFRP